MNLLFLTSKSLSLGWNLTSCQVQTLTFTSLLPTHFWCLLQHSLRLWEKPGQGATLPSPGFLGCRADALTETSLLALSSPSPQP